MDDFPIDLVRNIGKRLNTLDFPIDLVRNIGKRLNTKIDVSQFRTVCKSWRSSIPAYQTKPLIRACFYANGEKRYLNLIESVVYGLVKPPAPTSDSNIPSSDSCSWFIVKVREVESDQNNRVLRLHPLSSLQPPRALNLLDFRVLELGKSLVNLSVPSVRAAISSNPDWPALMVVADKHLYYCKLWTENCTLERYLLPVMLSLMDVVFYKGEFYIVAMDGTTIAIDSSLTMRSVASFVARGWEFVTSTTMYLVESLGELLLVSKSTHNGPFPRSFCVYKLKTAKRRWVRMRSLNNGSLTNRILFVGHIDDGCFVAPAQDFPGCDGNQIYFSHESLSSGQKIKGVVFEYVKDSELLHSDDSEDDDAVNSCPSVANYQMSYDYID